MYMAVLIFLKCLDLRKNAYSRTSSYNGRFRLFLQSFEYYFSSTGYLLRYHSCHPPFRAYALS